MTRKRFGIVYMVTNKINGKAYIGQTTQPLRMRRNDHHKQINNTKRHRTPFVNALEKYGLSSFEWKIIYNKVPIDKLDNIEKQAIIGYDTLVGVGWGYNLETGGNLNKKLSKETKMKISNSLKGHKVSKSTRDKISKSRKGKIAWNKGKKDCPKRIEERIRRQSKIWEIIKPDGRIEIIKNLSEYCR